MAGVKVKELRAYNDTIVLKLPRTQEKTISGLLWIPLNAREDAPEAVVDSIGPKAAFFCALNGVEVGSRVLFEQYAGLELVQEDGHKLVLVQPHDLKAVIEP